MLFVEALETVKCLDEGVHRVRRRRQHRLDLRASASPAGPAACCSTSTATRAASPASSPARASSPRRYGERFEPPASLVEKAERGETYADEQTLVAS